MKYNIDLIETLYKNYQEEGVINYRRLLIEDYKKATGDVIPISTLEKYIARIKIKPKTFNERTEEFQEYMEEKTHYSERYIEIGTSELLDPDDIIRLHGRNPETFELATDGSTRSKIGSNNEQGYLINSYSKATFKPRKFELTEAVMTDLLEQADITPLWIDDLVDNPSGLLELTLTDMHFGKNTYEDYKTHQDKTMRWIKSKEWQEVLIPIGNDLFNWDNINGTTTRGTQVGFEPDLEQAWEDAIKFYFPIIEEAIRQSVNVYIPYLRHSLHKYLSRLSIRSLKSIHRFCL